MRTITSTSLEERTLSVGLINDYLEYHRLKKYLKKLARWERQMMEAGLPPVPPDFNAISKGKAMTPNEAADLLRGTTPAPWDAEGFTCFTSTTGNDPGLVVNRWDAELAAAAPELAGALIELGEVNGRLKEALDAMLKELNIVAEEMDGYDFAEYRLDQFGIQEGDMD